MRSHTALLFIAAVTILLAGVVACEAAPDLMIYPIRVVMSDKARTAQVDVVNTSDTQASYKITLVRKRMTETGEFQDITAPAADEKFADDIVKYSPRQVTLLPGAGQTVRMMFKVQPNMPEGEYRSHLMFSKLPSAVKALPGKTAEETGSISMHLTANVGLSIPVIVRHGKLEANATIDPASVIVSADGPNKQILQFTLSRTGTRSIYGDVTAFKGGEKVGGVSGLAVYTPNTIRKVSLPLMEPNVLHPGDSVKIVFTEKEEQKPLAETTAVLR